MKTIVTITGIRPDFIRMSEIFKKLDKHFNHILIHTGQHFDKLLSDVFFDELDIRKPNYNLGVGGQGKEHFHQLAEVSVKTIELFRKENINPNLILFLGDSNSVTSAISLKKEGYKIGHIEAGMRSGDKRMLEEINRIVCDHCSDLLFVYHENYKEKLIKEGIDPKIIHVVGNTIVEVVNNIKNQLINEDPYWLNPEKKHILLDIHRPENFKYKDRLEKIIQIATDHSKRFELPVKMLTFPRTLNYINEYNISRDMTYIKPTPLMGYIDFIKCQMESLFIISDSGTAAEEPALLYTPVIIPRDFTERPESYDNNNSHPFYLNDFDWEYAMSLWWLKNWQKEKSNTSWLGNGTTSDQIIQILLKYFDE